MQQKGNVRKWVFFLLIPAQDIDITACASGRGQIIFGDSRGTLYLLERSMQLTEFTAYEEKVTHLYQLKQHNILVSVGVSVEAPE